MTGLAHASVGGPFAFVDGALDRADALRDDAAALDLLWPQARVVVLDEDGRAWADDDGALYRPTGTMIGGGPALATFLGLQHGSSADPSLESSLEPSGTGTLAWFAVQAETVSREAPRRMDLRTAAAAWPSVHATVFAQARALLHWHARHRWCGSCGGEVAFVRAGWLGRCARCGLEHYPRTDQAVIAAVSDGRRLLLGRQAAWPASRWSVLAGFVEPGESLEQTLAREVLEETGVRVRGCRYLASQPWPFPGSLMLGFLAHAEPDEPVPGDELEDARWFDVDEIRAGLAHDWDAPPERVGGGIVLSSPISIARWLVERWLDEVQAPDRAR